MVLSIVGCGLGSELTTGDSYPDANNEEGQYNDIDQGKSNDDLNEDSKDKAGDAVQDKENPNLFPYTAPLTGMGSLTKLDQRMMAVVFNNKSEARPQSGIAQADIVYEVLSEWYITRLVALYQSESPETIGPIRSIRPYIIDIVNGYDAIFAHAGGSMEALTMIEKNQLPSLDEIYGAGPYFHRVDFREPPHNLYTNMQKLREGAESKGYQKNSTSPDIQFISPDEEMSGETAIHIDITYHPRYKVSYHYNPQTELYTRYVNGEPHKDKETDLPLTMTNVFVIETEHKIIDNEGRRAIDMFNGGKGYLFQRGKIQQVNWKRVDGVIRPIQQNKEIGLYPGKTWVNIIADQPGLSTNVQYNEK